VLTGRTLWYLTRGTGVVALLLLTASLVLGILQVKQWARPGLPRFLTAGLHRNISLLSTAFIAAHIVTAVLDSYAPIRWVDAVVPFTSAYRPIWLGLGAVAVDLLIAITVTSLLRAHLGYRTWKAVHWLSYACWPVALVHSIGTGSDIREPWMLAVLLASLLAVLGSLWWRLSGGSPATAPGRTAAVLASIVALGALLGWTAAGPLQAGWAARAGTPANLLGTAGTAGTTGTATGTPYPGAASAAGFAANLTPPFSAVFTGTVSQAAGATGSTTVTIAGSLSGGATGSFDVTISGTPEAGGGVAMDASTVSLGPATKPGLYQGALNALSGSNLVASVTDGSGNAMTLTAALRLDQRAGTARGTVTAAVSPSPNG
jgi:sulfoxide reductase heme-binding subunit YedZ